VVVDDFQRRRRENPIVGPKSKNPQLWEWRTKNLGRLPGLKFKRTRGRYGVLACAASAALWG
jgi:hemoglobin